jgi:uncharacterized protein YecT (DUF1311 family)
LQISYNEAVDSVGRRLLRLARHFDRNWSNPLIKPGLVNEMMLAQSFYYIDTVGKAVEWQISVDAPEIKPKTISDHRNICTNAVAAVIDSSVAEWIFEGGLQEITPAADGLEFLFQRRRNLHCRTQAFPGGSNVVVGTGLQSGDRTIQVPDFAALPADTPLRRLSANQIKTVQNEFPRPKWCSKISKKAEALVCNTVEFAAADMRMDALYAQLLRRPGARSVDAIRSEQRVWTAERNACSDYLCVDNAYATRNINLRGAISNVP